MAGRLRMLAARLRTLLTGAEAADPGRAFDEEVRTHLELLAERFERQGLPPAEAMLAARRQFGNVTRLRQDRRETATFPPVELVWRVGRHAARQLRRAPSFTIAAVVSLALGIALTTAVFTLLDQLVLRLLPVAEPERLVMIWSPGPNLGDTRGPRASSFPRCRDLQQQAVAFDGVFCRYPVDAAVSIGARTESVRMELVSGSYFQVLRVAPALGRVFTPDADDRHDGAHPVVVLSHRYWRDRLDGDPRAVGRTILVNGRAMDIVGVVNAGFDGVDAAEAPQLWLPLRMKALATPGEDGLNDRHYDFVQIFGRLKRGYTAESARASLQPLVRRLIEQEAADPSILRASAFDRAQYLNRPVQVEPAATGYSDMRERYARSLVMLMGMAGLILLIACSNVASLLIARALARQREMAVRLSIGASRSTLIGQLLTESLLLSFAGAAAALPLASIATHLLLRMMPETGGVLLLHAAPDGRVLLFCIAAGAVTGMSFGLLPALQATRVDLSTALKASSGATTSRRSVRLRKALVTGQVAVSFLLLVAAGLFARTLLNLRQLDTGLRDIGRVVTFEIDPAKQGYPVPRLRALYSDLQARIEATPGVSGAAYTWIPLLQGWAPSWDMVVEGHLPRDGENMQVANNIVSPGYWRVMGVRLLAGREFDEGDRFPIGDAGRTPTVAVVNRSFATRFFGTQPAVGKRIGVGEDKRALGIEIVGVVEDSLMAGPRNGAEPQVFFSFLQTNFPISATFYVRTTADPAVLVPGLRQVVAALDPALPLRGVKTLDRRLDETLSAESLIAWLAVVFASLATLMAALGLYGVMAFAVAQRTREIGLRTALGATARSMLWLVMREVLALLGLGLVAGLPCALLLSRSVASQLFGVGPTDAWTIAASAATLLAVASAAAFLPARRARTIDPVLALRHD